MIYSIEKRKISGFGTIETVYEVRQYDGVYNNGIPHGGKTLKEVKTKKAAEAILRRKGMRFVGERVKGQEIWASENLWKGDI